MALLKMKPAPTLLDKLEALEGECEAAIEARLDEVMPDFVGVPRASVRADMTRHEFNPILAYKAMLERGRA